MGNRTRRLWDRLPFAGRLLFTASAALVIAGLVMLYTSARRDADETRADLRTQLESELQILPASLAELLVIGDFSTLQQTLDFYARRSNVDRIRYRDVSGAVLESSSVPAPVQAPAWFVAWLGLSNPVGEVPAAVGGRRYGVLEVTITAQHAINRAWSRLVQHLSILLLAIVLDFVGIWLVLRTGLKPLRALDAGSSALGRGDLSVRIPLQGSPELRHSIAAFNRMAESLQNMLEEVRASNSAVAENQARLNRVMEGSNDGFWDWNVDTGEVVYSQRWAEMLGFTLGDIDPTIETWRRLVHPDDLPLCQQALEKHFNGESTHYEIEHRVRRRDGSWCWVLDRGKVYQWKADGRPLRMAGTHTDITERKRAEESLRLLNDTLEQRVEEEVTKNREKDHILIQQSRLAAMGEMVHNIAHQWRQPINALALVLANIRDAYEHGELSQESLDDAVSTGQRLIQKMSTTIDDFRNFFRPNKEKAPFSLRQSLEEVKGILGASLGSHAIRLEVDVSGDVTALGYANEYAQVLLNLLNNAKEAIEEKGRGGLIQVRLAVEGGMAVVRVADNGGGIPAEVQPKIFDPYFTTKDKGTGIGLYMSKMIVETNMGGRIEARNTEGGAEFVVWLPLAPSVS